MRIGIYGGTFNPPHKGHIHAAKEAARVLGLDRLLIIPDNIPPHKVMPAGSANNQQRLEMTRLAFEGLPCAEVSDMELRRGGKSLTVDTVRELCKEYPNAEFWLLMGSDMLAILHLWNRPEVLLQMVKVGTFARGDAGEQEMFDEMLPLLEKNFHAEIRLIPMETEKAASSDIRSMIGRGEGENLLPEAVLGYIWREHLYETNKDMRHLTDTELRAVAMSYLKPRRMAHVLGTEKTAVHLAEKYGASVEKARVAALLHDCTKKLNMREQLALCEKYGIALDGLERKTDQLLHAKTGAALAQDVFGVDLEICAAIFWHTTGKANMTTLEKVIYLADYIEPNRNFPGVDRIRQIAEQDLDEGVAAALSNTVEHMNELGSPVHENTLTALRFLKG